MSTIVADELSEIREAGGGGSAGAIREDGLVPVIVIRPGVGRGKGRHIYTPKMLQEHAHIFKGWRMFVDHQSPEAKRRQGGLPRSVHDLGGLIKELWWDPTIPADPAHGPEAGAVVGLARPTRLIKSLIQDDPDLVETSISARATGVQPVQRDGHTAWLVEGIRPKPGSVDWVTEAGAGGKVLALMEALEESGTTEEEEREMAGEMLEALSDDEVLEHIRARARTSTTYLWRPSPMTRRTRQTAATTRWRNSSRSTWTAG